MFDKYCLGVRRVLKGLTSSLLGSDEYCGDPTSIMGSDEYFAGMTGIVGVRRVLSMSNEDYGFGGYLGGPASTVGFR